MKLKLAVVGISASILLGCMAVPQPEGASLWDHVFGDTSIHPEHPNHPSKRWFKAAEPIKDVRVKYVEELPADCIKDGAIHGCSKRYIVENYCNVFVKIDHSKDGRVKMLCTLRHEKKGHCEDGMNHPPLAQADCGPDMTYAQFFTGRFDRRVQREASF